MQIVDCPSKIDDLDKLDWMHERKWNTVSEELTEEDSDHESASFPHRSQIPPVPDVDRAKAQRSHGQGCDGHHLQEVQAQDTRGRWWTVTVAQLLTMVGHL